MTLIRFVTEEKKQERCQKLLKEWTELAKAGKITNISLDAEKIFTGDYIITGRCGPGRTLTVHFDVNEKATISRD